MSNGSIRVTNISESIGNNIIDIGRKSPMGNPEYMRNGSDEEREHVIEFFDNHLEEVLASNIDSPMKIEFYRILNLVKAGHDVQLQCFCAPKKCHGDIIKIKLEYALS